MTGDGLLPIGEVARRTGVATSALRFYERRGLLAPAARRGQRRHYPEACVGQVALIRLYQDAGFTLSEIGRLLAAGNRRTQWRRLAEGKLDELNARIADATRARDLLEHALGCEHPDLFECPNFRAALEGKLERSPPQ